MEEQEENQDGQATVRERSSGEEAEGHNEGRLVLQNNSGNELIEPNAEDSAANEPEVSSAQVEPERSNENESIAIVSDTTHETSETTIEGRTEVRDGVNQNSSESDGRSKKRKAESDKKKSENKENEFGKKCKREMEVLDDDDEEGVACTICMEPWTNSGSHRISSLKCGHFFGFSCIEKWLKGGNSVGCPNCNEKAHKKDIRVHFVSTLKAIDTSERDRAVQQLEDVKKNFRQLELEYSALKVR